MGTVVSDRPQPQCIEEHPWIEKEKSPLPPWVKNRYFLIKNPTRDGGDALVCFTALHSINDGITLSIAARREGMPWGVCDTFGKDLLDEYIEFLKEQAAWDPK
jgi:hypothetical protein